MPTKKKSAQQPSAPSGESAFARFCAFIITCGDPALESLRGLVPTFQRLNDQDRVPLEELIETKERGHAWLLSALPRPDFVLPQPFVDQLRIELARVDAALRALRLGGKAHTTPTPPRSPGRKRISMARENEIMGQWDSGEFRGLNGHRALAKQHGITLGELRRLIQRTRQRRIRSAK